MNTIAAPALGRPRPGTRVGAEGPYGAFTAVRRVSPEGAAADGAAADGRGAGDEAREAGLCPLPPERGGPAR
ncbi:hypothetical protein ACFYYH_01490 [Streptomyces sp. NPDC002018]|uniref:hypothetical protein n=1 Tax=Streptomyces sp. NPDC002018 TaxID=3364629 RepID=UPI00368040D9